MFINTSRRDHLLTSLYRFDINSLFSQSGLGPPGALTPAGSKTETEIASR